MAGRKARVRGFLFTLTVWIIGVRYLEVLVHLYVVLKVAYVKL